jgi:sulfite reductase (NADPH) flavoprotein alpha-component
VTKHIYLDLYGRPSKEFYVQLSEYATDLKEREKLIFLTTPDGQAEYKARVDDTVCRYRDCRQFET